ncbi:MAG: ABC transporter permease [Agriterribacter sp.]
MFKVQFLQAWRRMIKDGSYSLLHIIGLASGLACFIWVALWVADELSYDRFNNNFSRIVRIVENKRTKDGMEQSARTGAPLAAILQNMYPEVEKTVRLRLREELIVHNNSQYIQSGILLADASFFDVFNYKLIKGNKADVLANPFSVVLTRSTAKKYFGDADPVGQSLIIFMNDSTGHGANYAVTGLVDDPPRNAHFTFTMLASFKSVEVANPQVIAKEGLTDSRFYTYLLLYPNVKLTEFSEKLKQFVLPNVDNRESFANYSYQLQPLSDIHLRSQLLNEIAPVGDITQVYLFSAVGVFILLLAGINYANLATARSTARAKEVGVKKVMGAVKSNLITQYLTESILTAFIALMCSLLIAACLQPFFQQVTDKNINLFSHPFIYFFTALVTLLTGILSGIYPAFILSSFQPVMVLKGSLITSAKGVLLRKCLVVAQFIISFMLITAIVIVYAQMRYVMHKNLGYDKDALLFVRVNGNTDVIKGYEAFRNDLISKGIIRGVTVSNSLVLSGLKTAEAQTVDAQGNNIAIETALLRTDSSFLQVHGISLLAGEYFKNSIPGDAERNIVLNETAIKKCGWAYPQSALGKIFSINGKQGRVVGVVKDFHFNSLQYLIKPLAIYAVDGYFSRITIRTDVNRIAASVVLLENNWKKHFPGAYFDFDFMDNEIKAQYKADDRFSSIFFYFSLLSLCIACLGLYGLMAYETSQRMKEIGIRKILGASVKSIAFMLMKGFLVLIVIAGLIAVPITVFWMHGWLEQFAYRIHLSWWIFGIPVGIVLTVAVIIVGTGAIRAGVTNPLKSVRVQ